MADMTLDKIKALRAAVTVGEWSRYDEPQLPDNRYAIQSAFDALKPDVGEQIKALVPVAYFVTEADAEFIAAAPAIVDWLIAQLEATQTAQIPQ
jgi:hypothetical protein